MYAIQSWLALYYPKQKVYIETPRDAYEAYVVRYINKQAHLTCVLHLESVTEPTWCTADL